MEFICVIGITHCEQAGFVFEHGSDRDLIDGLIGLPNCPRPTFVAVYSARGEKPRRSRWVGGIGGCVTAGTIDASSLKRAAGVTTS